MKEDWIALDEAEHKGRPDYTGERFIPGTREVSIGGDVVYRPLRAWHAGTYAGEGWAMVGGDRSGCVHLEQGRGRVCSPPKVAVCPRCGNYAWSLATMEPVLLMSRSPSARMLVTSVGPISGTWHHPSCPLIRGKRKAVL